MCELKSPGMNFLPIFLGALDCSSTVNICDLLPLVQVVFEKVLQLELELELNLELDQDQSQGIA